VIEAEKLKAIGLGNRVDSEREVRKRKQLELQAMINEKKAELERLSAQRDSLTSVELQQKALIEKLTNNEA
jgi:intraflagellar transport protein 20